MRLIAALAIVMAASAVKLNNCNPLKVSDDGLGCGCGLQCGNSEADKEAQKAAEDLKKSIEKKMDKK